ncbi:MAG: Y-family DNA polymerase [Burkholderiaceae bacterium]
MRCWISLHHPLLGLETFRPRWFDPDVDVPGSDLPGSDVLIEHGRVALMSETAAYNGIRVGMREGGALMLCPEARLFYRDAQKEYAALEGIALAMMQFTPEVALAPEASLLMEVTGSLKLFRGPHTLSRLVRATVHALGFSVQLGMAPTAQGAWLLARYPQERRRRFRRVLKMGSMTRRLDALPCILLPAVRPHREWLEGIACKTLGQLRKLPHAGLQRRSSKQVIDSLERAYGLAPELFEWIRVAPTFSAWLELPSRVDHTEALLFAARRLVLQMVGWLRAQQLAVSRFALSLEHERGRHAIDPTWIEIALAEPAWHEEHLVRLLKERLDRIELAASVIALRLEAKQLSPMLPPTESLFREAGGTTADYHRLLELLTARLGRHSVLTPAMVADYRPEVCNEWMPADAFSAQSRQHRFSAANALEMPSQMERPFWMLSVPLPLMMHDYRPFYGSPLKLINGPERIECGWWDGSLAVRDYFIAQGEEGARYWLFRERSGNDWRWFLHGLFA